MATIGTEIRDLGTSALKKSKTLTDAMKTGILKKKKTILSSMFPFFFEEFDGTPHQTPKINSAITLMLSEYQ